PLASATKLIPDPERDRVDAPASAHEEVATSSPAVSTTAVTVAAAAAEARTAERVAATEAPEATEAPAATEAMTAVTASSAAEATTSPATPAPADGHAAEAGGVAQPLDALPPDVERPVAAPLVQIRTDGSGSTGSVRRPRPATEDAPPVSSPRAEQPLHLLDDGRRSRQGGGSRTGVAGRMLPVVVAIVAVIVIAVGLYVITNRNNGPTNSGVNHPGAGSGGAGSHHGKKTKAAPFLPAHWTVAVLNGTSVSGLAANVGKAIADKGYHKGSITNAAQQGQAATIVYYRHGARPAALHVARALKLRRARVLLASRSVLHACATTPTGAARACRGRVIVSVGQDLANIAGGSATG
ncbi:MAG: LytR C-terminal domain-containing protein, partial [Solirubrobacteraceae bacterium]